ncbi:MAG: G1 family glutamic endopeptidase [Nitrososphaerales archaeon]
MVIAKKAKCKYVWVYATSLMSSSISKALLLTLLVPLLVVSSIGVISPAGYQQTLVNGHKGGGKSFACPTISGADTSTCSTNWSGYADTGSGVTAVSGSWIVPAISCSKHGTSYVAIWVGIDGYTSSTVEQTGTLGECNSGVASYSAWFEFYPSGSVTITSFSVSPGDSITASVTYSSSGFTVTITNSNNGLPFSTTQSVSSAARSSAEWVVERPALCTAFHCQLSTLANFGSVSLTSSSATINGATGSISAFSDVAITMVGSSTGPILAEPSPLSTDGTSFSVAYQ